MKSPDDARDKPPRADRLHDLVIRAARSADAEAITAMVNMPGFRSGTLRLPFQTIAETRAWLDNPAPCAKQLVAEYEGQIIGDIGLTPAQFGRRRHAAGLGMGVHDAFVGRGVGSALIGAVLDIADNWLALRRIELTVFADNESAIRLYENNGFITEGRFTDFAFRDGRYVDAYSMARLKT